MKTEWEIRKAMIADLQRLGISFAKAFLMVEKMLEQK